MKKTLIVKRNNPNITLKTVRRAISVKSKKINITLLGKNKRGVPGPSGEDGKGVPTGGLPGQILVKTGADDYDTQWGSISGSDKNYVQNFNITQDVIVNHNLLKYPAVTVHDSAGEEVEGVVNHVDINTLELHFSAPFSGVVTCN